MTSFEFRSSQKELLDRNDIPFDEIRRNMKELDSINHYLGGHKITLAGLKELLKKKKSADHIHILEIGCGGGNNLRVIKKFADQKGLLVELKGVDINPDCISFAREQAENKGMEFICSDYKSISLDHKPDIIFSSLFCHHFSDEELIFMLGWMKDNSLDGFFINDLHRHRIAFYSIKLLTGIFSKSRLVKNDAPISVTRGFTKKEWKHYFRKAGIISFVIKWKWAFRWLVIYKHE